MSWLVQLLSEHRLAAWTILAGAVSNYWTVTELFVLSRESEDRRIQGVTAMAW